MQFENFKKILTPITILILLVFAVFLWFSKCIEKPEKEINKNIKERKEIFDETNKNLNDSTIDALSNNNFIVPKQ